jgi:hypothetical protein
MGKPMVTRAAWLLAGMLLLSGCIPSLNPIYTEKDIIFNEKVVGIWSSGESTETWDLQRRDEKSYQLTYTDREGKRAQFVAHLAMVEGTRFFDIFPEPGEAVKPGFYRIHQVPIHTIYLVKEVGEKVVLSAIDHLWMEDYLVTHRDEVPSTTFGSGRLLTASTQQLQEFLVDNKTRFTHDFELVRQP